MIKCEVQKATSREMGEEREFGDFGYQSRWSNED